MNNQEAFTKMVQHLRKQGEKAMVGGSCRYRAPGGLMCAVGCLIPDNLYSPLIEGQGSDSFTHRTIAGLKRESYSAEKLQALTVIADFFEGVDNDLIDEMQHIHDSEQISKWDILFESVAEAYSLQVPEGRM